MLLSSHTLSSVSGLVCHPHVNHPEFYYLQSTWGLSLSHVLLTIRCWMNLESKQNMSKKKPISPSTCKIRSGFLCLFGGVGVVCLISWHNEGTNISHVARHVCSVTKSSQFYLLNSPPIHLLGSGCSYRLAGFNTPMQPPCLHLGPSATHFLSNTSLKQCSWACGKSFSNRKLRS